MAEKPLLPVAQGATAARASHTLQVEEGEAEEFYDEYEGYGSSTGIPQPLMRYSFSGDGRQLSTNRSVSFREAGLVVFGGIMAYSFVVCLENVIVFPSLWPRLLGYCDDYSTKELHYYLAWTMGAFSLGRGFSALVINGQEPTSFKMRVSATICFLFSACGCAIYVFADSPQQLIVSRTFSGLGAGALTLMVTSISALSSEKSRTSAISSFFVAAAVGEVAGPALAWATSNASFDLGGITVNKYNNVGLWTFALFCIAFCFVCKSIDANAVVEDGTATPLSCSLLSRRLVIVFVLSLLVNMSVSAWETVVTPLAQVYFSLGVEFNSLIFIMSGMVLFFSNIVLVRAAQRFKISDEVGCLLSIFLSIIGALILLVAGDQYSLFLVGNLLYTLGTFCPLTFVTSMFTKTVRERQGFFIGVFRAGCAGIRVVGNLLAATTLPKITSGTQCSTNSSTLLGIEVTPSAAKDRAVESEMLLLGAACAALGVLICLFVSDFVERRSTPSQEA